MRLLAPCWSPAETTHVLTQLMSRLESVIGGIFEVSLTLMQYNICTAFVRQHTVPRVMREMTASSITV